MPLSNIDSDETFFSSPISSMAISPKDCLQDTKSASITDFSDMSAIEMHDPEPRPESLSVDTIPPMNTSDLAKTHTPLPPIAGLIRYLACLLVHMLISLLWYATNVHPRQSDDPEDGVTWFFHWMFNIALAMLDTTAVYQSVTAIGRGRSARGYVCVCGALVGASAVLAGILWQGWEVKVWYEWVSWASLGVFPGSLPMAILITGLGVCGSDTGTGTVDRDGDQDMGLLDHASKDFDFRRPGTSHRTRDVLEATKSENGYASSYIRIINGDDVV